MKNTSTGISKWLVLTCILLGIGLAVLAMLQFSDGETAYRSGQVAWAEKLANERGLPDGAAVSEEEWSKMGDAGMDPKAWVEIAPASIKELAASTAFQPGHPGGLSEPVSEAIRTRYNLVQRYIAAQEATNSTP